MTVALDFNENPIGTSPAVVEAVTRHAAQLHLYPRGLHRDVAALVADHFSVDPDEVLVVAGVDEAMDLLLLDGGSIACLAPGFPGYRERAAVLGAPVHDIVLDTSWHPPTSGSWTTAGVVVLTQPNNPTGNLLPRAWIDDVVGRTRVVCVDETFIDFSGAPSLIDDALRRPNLCVFKSFSKAYGVAGLRIGALFGSPDLLARLGPRQRFYSVDAIALHALRAALDDRAFQQRCVSYVLRWRADYAAALRVHPRLFARVEDTSCNFVIAACVAPTDVVVRSLAAGGVRVADCAALGLPGWIRVTVGPPGALDRLRAALAGADHLVEAPR